MYRHGFGDCFLVRFFNGEKTIFSLLIDCGLKYNDSVPGIKLKDVVDDITTTLLKDIPGEKPKLNVLAVTHEHWDHVSGFHPDKGFFDHFDIEKIWMGWTENPDDDEASLIQKHINKSITALAIANEKIKESIELEKKGKKNMTQNQKDKLTAKQSFSYIIGDISSYFGEIAMDIVTPSGITLKDKYKISVSSRAAMDHVKSFANKSSSIAYLYPGDIVQEHELPGVRFYVLGPPKSALLNKNNPSKGSSKEVYIGLSNSSTKGFVNHLLQMSDNLGYCNPSPFPDNTDNQSYTDTKPFTIAQAHTDPYYRRYYDKAESYRTIDDDYLNLTGSLAMQLDSDTNNTSLAFAIEFIESGKVMLFPADAQVGSWLSWHDLKWDINSKEVSLTSLLNRTVFYKTGHHASHNATLKEQGLELMNSSELVVFIPEKENQYNGIPYEPLIKRLEEKSKGRTFFSADSNHPPEKILKEKHPSLTMAEWKKFKERIIITDTYIELTVTQ